MEDMKVAIRLKATGTMPAFLFANKYSYNTN